MPPLRAHLIVARLVEGPVLVPTSTTVSAPTARPSTSWQAGARFASDGEQRPMSNPTPRPDPARVAQPSPAPTTRVCSPHSVLLVQSLAPPEPLPAWCGRDRRPDRHAHRLPDLQRTRPGPDVRRWVRDREDLQRNTVPADHDDDLGWDRGFVVGIVRMVTSGPTWAVALGISLASASFAGAIIVHTDGVDFRLLEPLWLTQGSSC